jgi:hypothetical protein
MKQCLFSLITIVIIFSSCSNSKADDALVDFIPGTYTRQSDGEFGKAYDTIVISLQNKISTQFKIVRYWRYNRVLDGKPLEPEYKVNETSGIYEPSTKSLKESETLELFTFDIDKKLLFDGPNKFNKIK